MEIFKAGAPGIVCDKDKTLPLALSKFLIPRIYGCSHPVSFTSLHCLGWLVIMMLWLSTWLHLESTKSSSGWALLGEVFLIGLFKAGRFIPKSWSHFLLAAHIKEHGRKKLCLPACPHSSWQDHLSCCCSEVFLHWCQNSRVDWRPKGLQESTRKPVPA